MGKLPGSCFGQSLHVSAVLVIPQSRKVSLTLQLGLPVRYEHVASIGIRLFVLFQVTELSCDRFCPPTVPQRLASCLMKMLGVRLPEGYVPVVSVTLGILFPPR